MPQASFSLGGNTVTFSRSPSRPACSLGKIHPREETAAAVPVVYDPLATEDLQTLNLRLTTAERALLEFFFLNVARGMSLAFTYTDIAGVARTARFNQAQLSPKERAYDSHSVEVALRIGS